jgi:hypothetical protein
MGGARACKCLLCACHMQLRSWAAFVPIQLFFGRQLLLEPNNRISYNSSLGLLEKSFILLFLATGFVQLSTMGVMFG